MFLSCCRPSSFQSLPEVNWSLQLRQEMTAILNIQKWILSLYSPLSLIELILLSKYLFIIRDAEDAVRSLDGTRIAGSRVRVEMSNGKSRERGGGGRRDRGDRRSRSRSKSRSKERVRRRSPSYRSMSRGRRSRSRSRS